MLKCPICKNKVEENAFTEIYLSSFNHQEYKKYECSNCKLHWWEPLKIIPEFYESEVFGGYIISFHEGRGLNIGYNHHQFFNYFPKNIKGKLLDVGCGNGAFLKEVKKLGFEIYGMDFDAKSIETAKRHLGVNTLYAMSLEKFYKFAVRNNLSFDVITFFEVLEHQDNPKKFLEMVKELLKPKGYIAGSVPNRESIFTQELYQRGIERWVDHPPHHFLRFSKKSLENALKICKFKDVEVYKFDFPKEELPLFIEKKFFGKMDKLKIWLKGKALGNQRLASILGVEEIEKINPSFISRLLKILKKIKNFAISPFIFFNTLFYLNKLKENGTQIYFQAKK